ncbi:hypothetical protein AAE02nite_13160 [Adhaeribacter aerolatus]|uniref:TonB-dependent receptor n=1 Tax=Adhaeribacter aerolatus TaxID=670289 RepID=A0A512AVB1_9BACT|nr:hypothetical protein [Adhaeribacter aerolatus]GEO03652.1 hypothetical protein AAE02nite_13160 [Adhaeribacter aerolatus]
MSSNLKKISLITFCSLGVFWSLPLAAQQTGWGEKNKLEDAEIVVEKNRVNELPEATRNFEKLRIPPPEKKPRQVNYRFADYRLATNNLNLPMRVLTIKQEDLTQVNGNYIKLGLGNYSTAYVKGYFHNKRDNQFSYGADVSHVASAKGPVDGSNSGVSNSEIKFNAESYTRDLTVGGNLYYNHDRYNFYGYSPVIEKIDRDTIKQVFNRIGADIFFNNKVSKSELQFQGGVGFKYFTNRFGARESNILTNIGVGYALDENAKINVDAKASFVGYKDSTSINRGYFRLRPSYESVSDLVSLSLGAVIAYTGDEVNNARKLNIYPSVRVGYEVVDDQFQLFAGVEGDLKRVTLHDLTQENPYLNQDVQVADENKVLDFYGGLTGNLGSSLKFTARAGYQSFRNLYFFNASQTDSTKFDLVYDNGTTKVINFLGELSYNYSERFRLGLKTEINKYTTDLLAKPFHRPAFQTNISGSYNYNDKIYFHTELYYLSRTYGQVFRRDNEGIYRPALKETDNITDLNLKVDYRFSNKFSTFVMGNNLLGNQYQRFVNYPNKGLQLIIGASYIF